MASRKTRKVNKRFAKVNDEWPDKDEANNANKINTRKKKLSNMLGSHWSKEELERFYESYRKYGKDWRKVAGTIRYRSVEMVEALYNMNRAFLSLQEGIATAAGLIAMMTDHYDNRGGSDSDRKSNDVLRTTRKPQKRGRGKFRLMSRGPGARCADLLPYQSSPSSYGCMSAPKRKRSGDLFASSRPRAVGKRTPRVLVSNMARKDDLDTTVPSNKHGLKSTDSATVDEGAHVAALALAEAFQRGGSPHVSQNLSRRAERMLPSSIQSSEKKDSELPYSKLIGVHMHSDCFEGSVGSMEAENGDFAIDDESACAFEIHQMAKKLPGKRPKPGFNENVLFDDDSEACSGTEEGTTRRKIKDEINMEVIDEKTSQDSKGSKKRSRQLFFGDESSALDALQTLADLSVNILFPGTTIKSELSAQVKEEQYNDDNEEKSSIPETFPANRQRGKSIILGKKDRGHSTVTGPEVFSRRNAKPLKVIPHDTSASSELKQITCRSVDKLQKHKRKSLVGKVPKPESSGDAKKSESRNAEVSVEEGKRSISKAKRSSQVISLPKKGKLIKPQDQPSSTDLGMKGGVSSETIVEVPTENQILLRRRVKSRRKMDLTRAWTLNELTPNDNAGSDSTERCLHSINNKDKLFHCLSSLMMRRWCVFEWFYSAIDYPWFARSEYDEYLNYVRLGHVPKLTRVERCVIRSSLGKPRRFSERFLQEEREKLHQYRESVRTHYTELRAGVREGLPTDLARPLSVGQRVIACHAKTREVHDGSILTVDRNRCRVQFDRPELGVEFVMDIDCMPLNPLENMPENLRRQCNVFNKICHAFVETKLDDQPKNWTIRESVKFAPSDNLDMVDGLSSIASSYPMITLMKQAKGDTIDDIIQAKAAVNEAAVATQQAIYNQPSTLAQIQAREADIRALAELARALDLKEALLTELRHMNEEVSGTHDCNPIKDLEHFRKQYATLLLNLRQANNEVTSALLFLRQRNTYHENSAPTFLRHICNSGAAAGLLGSSSLSVFRNEEFGSHVVEVIDSSREKAKALVDVAVMAMDNSKESEDAFVRIGEALDSASMQNSISAPSVSAVRYTPDPGNDNSTYQDHTPSCRFDQNTVCAISTKSRTSDAKEVRLPVDLISSCVATLYMIQSCTERQYPPAEVAQILDSAVARLHPRCKQNLPIYREIETCMGIIKNQMLALIPSPATVFSSDASVT